MTDKTPLPLGLVNTPPVGLPYFPEGLGAGEDLPDQYIVPAFRHWFDENFKPLSDQVNTTSDGIFCPRRQKWIDRCVAEAIALQKTSHEKKWMSARDGFGVTKQIDAERGRPLDSYGATIPGGMEALKRGIASEAVVNSDVDDSGNRKKELDFHWVNDAVLNDRKKNAGADSYLAHSSQFRRVLFTTGHPIVTSCEWYVGDNNLVATDPFLPDHPVGKYISGHAFGTIGWIEYHGEIVDVYANSFGSKWGLYGLFFVRQSALPRISTGFVHVDKEQSTLAELLAKYDGKNLRLAGTPDFYRCELGVLRKYPDELVFWAHGNVFGYNTYDIPQEDFERIPQGADMRIDDGPHRELVRQIRQHYGQL